MTNHPEKHILVLYHANCPDGFGAAYAAWKKFGDSAEYIPVVHGNPPPENLKDKEVYIVDFSYPKEVLLLIESEAKRLVVLDHHVSSEESVQSVREHIFNLEKSGAGIAWEYFHSSTPLPLLLAHIQDRDLWRHALHHGKEIGAYLGTVPFTFDDFERIEKEMETEDGLRVIIEKGAAYSEYYEFVCLTIADKAEEIEFEGYKILAVAAPSLFKSEIGHMLALRQGPFAMIWIFKDGFLHCSLRGVGSIDLAALAEKYGGGGHHNAASFRVPIDQPLPFTLIPKL